MSHLSKYLNLLQSGFSYLVSSALHKPVVYGMPPFISIELTNHCNLRCPECPSGSGMMTRKRGFMDIALFENLIKDLGSYLYNINLYFQGEPMLHRDFFSFLKLAEGIPLTVSTNGHFLSADNATNLAGSGLKKLIISLDGLDQETYSAYRKNGNLETVLTGIENITDALKKTGSKMKIELQVLVNRYNENQVGELRRYAIANGVSFNLKSMQIYSETAFDEWLPAEEKYRRYILNEGVYRIRSFFPRRCARLWLNPVLTWDGKVVPCCFDKNADHVMGDLNRETFNEIWYGNKYRVFREDVLKGREKIPVCRNCTSGLQGVKL